MNDVSVVIPVYNESIQKLNMVYNKLKKKGAEVIIVDDGSTPPITRPIVSVTHSSNIGYGAAIKSGIRQAKRSIILTMDSDGQHRFDEAYKLYQAFKLADCQMLIGARRGFDDRHRVIARLSLNLLASIFHMRYIQDFGSGLRIFNKEVYSQQELPSDFTFNAAFTMLAMKTHQVEFFPINLHPRWDGSTKINMLPDGLKTLKCIISNGLRRQRSTKDLKLDRHNLD